MRDQIERCQGCGAPIKGMNCEYCGRSLIDHYKITNFRASYPEGRDRIETLQAEIDRLQCLASMDRQIEHYIRIFKQMEPAKSWE